MKCQGIASSPTQGRGHDVNSDVYDALYYFENGKMNIIIPIDLNNKK